MAQWLYRIVPSRSEMVADATPEEQRIVGEHFAYLVELRDRGVLVLAGRTQETEGTFGITIFEADDEPAARAVMNADPAVAAGVFVASLHPYRIAVARDGLAG
ncbi:YciI family protein [Microbacterium trichothecenolyticum]|uniref:YciI-like protein n=1 Tax=Microbacterium trichothecenolyticum TaxID=69370 RepID=A0A0M2HG84_MICTR|nr:YciI family protein [Microbacterium trichothecenolyticum]KJL43350.1 YciI-like protein [Microbacterium trichothecenolyticum]